MRNIDDIVAYYSNLLIIQYHDLPKAKAMIELFVRQALVDGLVLDLEEAFNVDTAVGAQLDIIGKYVNLDRFYQGQTLTDFFALTDYNETLDPAKIGLTDYTTGFAKFGKTITYNDYLSNNQTLGDDDFRFLIKLRILQNNINYSHGEIDDVIFKFFGMNLFADSTGGMVMYYFYTGIVPAILTVALQKKLLPKPMAVRLNGLIVHTKPFFALASYANGVPAGIVGLGSYTGGNDAGEMLDYNKITAG